MKRHAGFSLVEVLVALTVFVIVGGIVLSFFSHFGRTVNTESSDAEMQQAARVALDELSRNVQQAGYGIERADPYNPSRWQRDLIHAGPYVLAFNADVDSSVGSLAPSETVALPGEVYRGEGPSAVREGAETYVYTLDANGDGAVTTQDRSAAPSGSFNPAAETQTTLDFALFRRILGYDGSGYGGATIPVTGYLFTNATPDARYPDGTTPEPLFTYWLTEDLNRDGALSPQECVVGTCPPSSPRKPTFYLWGDSDSDGRLSESEKTALRTLPVGSPSFTRNPLASGGLYVSSPLTADAGPSSADASLLRVADASRFGAGQYVSVGQGETAESFVLEATDAATHELTLSGDLSRPHAASEPVTILPQTLLRAIRTVQLNFDAVTPVPDSRNGVIAAGRMGRRGTRGLDERVQSFRRSIELVNLQTDALLGEDEPGQAPTCPLTILAECQGSPLTNLLAFAPAAASTPLRFTVRDATGHAKTGVPVGFTQSNASAGTLSSKTVKSDRDGRAEVRYNPGGFPGVDTVTATATCADGSQQLVRYRADLTVRIGKLRVATANDCLATVSASNPAPRAGFTLDVEGPSGSEADVPVRLDLTFDRAYLPDPPVFTAIEGELAVDGRSAGTTDASGAFASMEESTGSSGVLTGRVALTRDATGRGTRLVMRATPRGEACGVDGATVETPVTFYALALDSESPRSGCTEVAPCDIPGGSRPPTVAARLTVNGQGAPNAVMSFTKTDMHAGSGASILMPGSSVVSDGSGTARVLVANNGSATITSAVPLTTTVDASSIGDPAVCGRGSIALAGSRSQFRFAGSAGECETDVQQAWFTKPGSYADKLCLDLRNANSVGGCPVRPTGISVTVFRPDGINPDNIFKLRKIEGGAVASSPSCATGGKVTLFTSGCNRNTDLANGQRWNFVEAGGCHAAPSAPSPGSYFVFNLLEFTANLAGTGRRVDVTVYYQCEGVCPLVSSVQRTFRLRAP